MENDEIKNTIKIEETVVKNNSRIITVTIFDFLMIPYTRQTYKGRFNKRAMRYNNNQVAFKNLMQLGLNMYSIEPFDKKDKIEIHSIFHMKKEGNSNNVKNIDIDNMYKALSDGLQGVLFYNDTQVFRIESEKINANANNLFFSLHNVKPSWR